MIDKWLDRWFEKRARSGARHLSRRGFMSKLGVLMVGASALPVLPVYRSSQAQASTSGDPQDCNYWRYCAIDGYLCSCCGGSKSSCPPGTVMSPITWIGTCRNPDDGKDYIISYNDCCGKSACGRCQCIRNEGDTPAYLPATSNNINWCTGSPADVVYNCSTAIIIGVRE